MRGIGLAATLAAVAVWVSPTAVAQPVGPFTAAAPAVSQSPVEPLVAFPRAASTASRPMPPPVAPRRGDGGPNAQSDADALAISITPAVAVLHGGDGVVLVAPTRAASRNVTVRGVRLAVRAPANGRLTAAAGMGWRCSLGRGRGDAVCRSSRGRDRAGGLRPISIRLNVGARRRFGRGSLRATLTWSERDGRRYERDRSREAIRLFARRPLSVSARAVDRRISDAVRGRRAQPVALAGRVGARTDQPIRYAWRQICPADRRCPRVRWTSVRSGALTEGQPVASFAPPQVGRPRTLRFKLVARDHRGAVADTAAVRVLPSEIASIEPRLGAAGLAGELVARRGIPGRPVPIGGSDRAPVRIGGRGATIVSPGARVRLRADVVGQRERGVRWTVVRGPRGMLNRARRQGRDLVFRAPAQPGAFIVGVVATTPAGRFERDELVSVRAGPRRTASGRTEAARRLARAAAAASARVAAQSAARQAFCSLLTRARAADGPVEIPLESGEPFRVRVKVPAEGACSGNERLTFSDGSGKLGRFSLDGLTGTITLERGLVVESGRLVAPEFWSNAAPTTAAKIGTGRRVKVLRGAAAAQAAQSAQAGPSIGFTLPDGAGGVQIGLGVRLGDGGWEDLAGELVVNESALAKLPLAGSLPTGWKLDHIRLGVNPASRRFELSASAKGPANSGGDATLSLEGQLTFDGIARVRVSVANLAVLQSVAGSKCGGQTTVSASGELELLPAQEYDPGSDTGGGAVFPAIEVRVSGRIDCYAPADGLTISGEVSWESGGALRVSGSLTADLRGAQDLKAEIAGSYTNANNWDIKAGLTSADGLRIGDLLTLERLEGSIARAGNGADARLRIKLEGAVRDIKPALGVTVTRAAATLSNTGCTFAGPLAGTVRARAAQAEAASLCLTVEAGVALAIPGVEEPLKVDGGLVIDLKSLKFSVAGGLRSGQPFGPKAFNLTSVTFYATNAGETTKACNQATAPAGESQRPPSGTARDGGVSFGFTARGNILGVAVNQLSGAYTSGGHYCLAADLGAADLPAAGSGAGAPIKPVPAPSRPDCTAPGAPALQNLRVSYSSESKRAALDGVFCLPEGLRSRLGTVAEGTGELSLAIATTNDKLSLEGRARYTLPSDGYWLLGAAAGSRGASPDPTKAALALKTLEFSLKLGEGRVDLGLNAAGKLRIPQPSDPQRFGGGPEATRPTEANINVGATASLGAQPSFTLYTSITGSGAPGCTSDRRDPRVALADLFGQPGLNVCSLGIAGTIAANPSVSASASFALPAEWGSQLGISNASYSLGFAIANVPCVDLEISQIDAARPAVDLFNRGAVVANKLHILIAPVGCRLPSGLNGAGQETPAGFRVDFDGALFGTPIQLAARLELSGKTFALEAKLQVGAPGRPFKLGPIEFEPTTLELTVRPAQGLVKFRVETGVRLGSALFELKADFNTSGEGVNRTVKLEGSGRVRFELLRATFDGDMTFSFSSSPAGASPPRQAVQAKFKGRFDLNLVFFRVFVEVENLEYDSTKGGLQALIVKGGTRAGQPFGPAELAATGAVSYSRSADTIRIDMGLSIRLWNIIDYRPELHINLGPVRIPFRFGPDREVNWIFPPLNAGIKISGSLGGALTWSPSEGFGITFDNDFRVQACFIGCFTLVGIEIDKQNGSMTITVIGIPIRVPTAVYSGRDPPPPSYGSRDGLVLNALVFGCLDVSGGSTANQTPLRLSRCTSNPSQRFYLNGETGQLHVLGKCVDAGPAHDLARLNDCNGESQQRWSRDGFGRIVGARGRCLAAVSREVSANTSVPLRDCNLNADQQALRFPARDLSGTRWRIAGELRPGRTIDACLDVAGRNPVLGARLTVGQCGPNDPGQSFHLSADGLMQVGDPRRDPGTAACVSVSDDAGTAQLRLAPCVGGPGDTWSGPNRDGSISLRERDGCMRTPGTIGSPVVLGRCDGNEETRWSIGGY